MKEESGERPSFHSTFRIPNSEFGKFRVPSSAFRVIKKSNPKSSSARSLSLAFRAQVADLLTGDPHFALGDFLQFLFELLTVVGPAVGLERPAGFLAPRWAVVEQFAYIQSMPLSAISG